LNKIDPQSVSWKYNSNKILQNITGLFAYKFWLGVISYPYTLSLRSQMHARVACTLFTSFFLEDLGSSSQIKELRQRCVRLMANVQSKHKTHNWNEASHFNSSKNWTFWHKFWVRAISN
jgi:hypothetical protein